MFYKVFSIVFFTVWLLGCYADLSPSRLILADNNIALAIDYLQHQQPNLAKQYLVKAEKIAPTYSAVWYSLAYYEEQIKNFKLAEHNYLYAIHLSPSDGAAHNNYGVFLCRRGNYEGAMHEFLLATHAADYPKRESIYRNIRICKNQFSMHAHYYKN